ncbi:hypothetical protein SFC66_17000 [Terribacillus saccharophilus]|uniref:hypothetical protein n=1 Tax=Terribacillus saccharophilus TaxID=361277 RepID=UPI0039826B06
MLADKLFETIKALDSKDKHRLLELLYDEYYAGGGAKKYSQDKEDSDWESDMRYIEHKIIQIEKEIYYLKKTK